jgi:putative SOS response-associated peptidase YedK
VILPRRAWDAWLDPQLTDTGPDLVKSVPQHRDEPWT